MTTDQPGPRPPECPGCGALGHTIQACPSIRALLFSSATCPGCGDLAVKAELCQACKESGEHIIIATIVHDAYGIPLTLRKKSREMALDIGSEGF